MYTKYREPFVTAETSYDTDYDDQEQTSIAAPDISALLNDLRSHLTVEEMLCISIFKNTTQHRNNAVYQAFIYKYHGKKLSRSAVSHKKKTVFKVLRQVSALLQYKRTYPVDYSLKELLTKRQYELLMLYERRIPVADISVQLNRSRHSIFDRYKRIRERLDACTDPVIVQYCELLHGVLKFSRKRNLI